MQPEDSEKAIDDQWIVVTAEALEKQIVRHYWRMVTLRNQAGKLSPGLQCVDCGLVERVTPAQLRGHGNRIERSKDK